VSGLPLSAERINGFSPASPPPPRTEQPALADSKIATYLFCVGVVNVCFGAAIALTLSLLGMPNPMMWGGVAALFNFIPYFGPVVGVLTLGAAGLLAFDTLGAALLPAGAYLLLHSIESNLVTPVVLGRRFTLNPVIIFVVLIF